MQDARRRSIRAACLTFIVAVTACGSPDGSSLTQVDAGVRATLLPELAAQPAIRTPVDVREVVVDVAEAPRPHERSAAALDAALARGGRRAFIGVKSPGTARMSARRLVAVDSMSADLRRKPRGVRAAISARDAALALNALAARGVRVLAYHEHIGVAYVELPGSVNAAALAAAPTVDYLEPDEQDRRIHASASPVRRPATSARSTLAAAATSAMMFVQTTPWGISQVRAPDAWAYSTGSSSRILIIDTGHQQGHVDLPSVPSGNCMGSFGGCNDPQPTNPYIPHGSHVAGIALARDNSIGVVGVAKGVPDSSVFVAGACNDLGGCSYNEIAAALNWSVTGLGARGVINMSFGGPSFNQTEANAIASANAAGHVLVASAGNSGSNQLNYPANYTDVLGIAAILPNKDFATYGTPCMYNGSSWGSHVDFVAPWYALSTVPTDSYGDETGYPGWCGTSMAAPHVAGIVALIRTKYTTMRSSSVYTRLRDTAEPLGPAGWDDHFGFGLPRAHLAVTFDRPTVTASIQSGKAKLSWFAIPFATEYRIYRRVTPSLCPAWQLWNSTTGTSLVDTPTSVSSFYGYSTYPPSQTAVSYYVTTVAEGVESSIGAYSTFIPVGTPFC